MHCAQRDFVGFAGNPSKTNACNVECHAQSTFGGGSENDIQMCANKQRGAKRGLRSKRILPLSTAVSSSPAAVAQNTRTCGNDLTPLKNGICQRCSSLKRHITEKSASSATSSGHTTSERADDGGCGDGGTVLE